MLAEEENVFRLVLSTERDKQNNKIPALRCFRPKPNDFGKLSVEAENLTTPIKTLSRWGASYNSKGEFKDYKSWEIFSLNVGIVKLMDKTITIYHDPITTSPKEKGKPDNPAHALIDLSNIIEDADLAEALVKMRNHALEGKIDVDMAEVDKLVKEYRSQWD